MNSFTTAEYIERLRERQDINLFVILLSTRIPLLQFNKDVVVVKKIKINLTTIKVINFILTNKS